MLLIKNGKVLTMGPQGVLEQADVLIGDDGKIIEVAANLEASGAEILDAKAGGRGPGGCCLLYMCCFVGECAYFKWQNNIDPATNVN